MRTARISFFVFVTATLCQAACSGDKVKPRMESLAPEPIDWTYLPDFRAELGLPALLIGESNEYSKACLKTLAPTEEDVAESVLAKYRNEKTFQTRIRAAFKSAVKKSAEGNAAFDYDSFSRAMDKWEVNIEGMKYVSVDPADVDPVFDNSSCTIPDIGWFRNNRAVVIGLYKATRITMKTDTALPKAVKTVLDANFWENTGTLSGEFGLKFSKSLGADGSVTISATNVFFAYRATRLHAHMCEITNQQHWKIEPDKDYVRCGYTIRFKPALSTPGQYHLSITPKVGNTAGFLEEFEKRAMRAIDAMHLFGIRITRTPSGDHEATLTTLLVGPKG